MQLELGKSYKLTVKNDGIQIEEIKEDTQYYSGKVVCVENKDDFTVGRVYAFVNGKVKDNGGCPRPQLLNPERKVKSLKEWNDIFDCAKFIEYKGEANA